jgi:hypothetical protein
MSYTLNFSLKLKRDGLHIIYDSESFAENPISVSVPDVVKILEIFIENFEEVGIVDKISTKTTKSNKKMDNDKNSNLENASQKLTVVNTQSLKSLSGKVYICKSKELDQTVLDQFSTELTKYIQDNCLKLSPKNFLTKESNLFFSGLSEVLELHNYLTRYTKSRKKIYQNGYIYIMPV